MQVGFGVLVCFFQKILWISTNFREFWKKPRFLRSPGKLFWGATRWIYKDFASNNLSEICFHWWADECLSSSKKRIVFSAWNKWVPGVLVVKYTSYSYPYPAPTIYWCDTCIYIYTCAYMNRLHICSMVIWHWKVLLVLGVPWLRPMWIPSCFRLRSWRPDNTLPIEPMLKHACRGR